MDSLTQIAIGIATTEAVAGKQLKNKSFLYGAILGTLPDLDVIIGKLFSYEQELAFHRAFTHSILGIIILSPLVAYILSKIDHIISFKKWCYVICATFLTHIIIDLFTSWGVQLFYPLPQRFSFKILFVVDILYTLPWLVILIIIFFKKEFSKRLQLLKIAMTISSLYVLLASAIKIYINQQVEISIAEQHLSVQDYITKPTFSNIILWNINIKTKDGYYVGNYSLFDNKSINYLYFPNDNTANNEIVNEPRIKKLIESCEGWYIINKKSASEYILNDLRFGWITNSKNEHQFVFAYHISNQGGISITPLPKTTHEGKKEIMKIINKISGKS